MAEQEAVEARKLAEVAEKEVMQAKENAIKASNYTLYTLTININNRSERNPLHYLVTSLMLRNVHNLLSYKGKLLTMTCKRHY